MPGWNRKANNIFLDALEIAVPADRYTFMVHACGGDPELQSQVNALMEASEKAGDFLENPPHAIAIADCATVGMSSADVLGSEIGPYKIRELLGEGGMGSVYVAEQKKPVCRKVALKVVKAGMDSRQVLARFDAERQTLALMDHPHIAKVLDAGTSESGRPYFVMELVRGVPITEFCDSRKLTTRQRLELFIKVCQAVQHAHQKGIIHRDIKPSNVLVTLHDDLAVPKVIDFGIAKATSQLPTEHSIYTGFNQMVGTPLYMSPEQAEMNALDIDTRSDVYSLGVLLYELITGTTPFDKETMQKVGFDEMRRLIREVDPPRPSDRVSTLKAEAQSTVSDRRGVDVRALNRVLRGELDWIAMKAMEKDRTRRYESPNTFAADVLRYLNGEPVLACPPSAVYRLRKFTARNKAALFAALAVLVALSTGLAGTTLALFETQQQRILAETARNEESKQRDQAEKNEQAARQAAEESSMVLSFLEEKILPSCRPEGQEGGLGKDVTIRQAIDAAEKQISGSFETRPRVEASIRHAMGLTYRYLGEPELEIAQFQRVVKIRQVANGADHVATLNAVQCLAHGFVAAGRLDAALPLLKDNLAIRKTALGPDHPDTLTSMNEMALLYEHVGKFHEAMVLLEEILAKRTSTLGADNPKTLLTVNNLASVYQKAGRVNEALALLKKNADLCEATFGTDHPDTLTSLNNLALAYSDTGHLDLAIPLYETVMAKRKEQLGADHPQTYSAMNGLGTCFLQAGDVEKAIPLLEECVAGLRIKVGPDHPDTLRSVSNLAAGYNDANRLDEALKLQEENVAAYQAKLGHDHPETLRAMNNLAQTCRNVGRFDEAISLSERVLAKRSEKLGADHPDTVSSMGNLGSVYLKANEPEKGLPILQQFLLAQKSLLGSESPELAGIQASVARDLLKAGLVSEVEPILRECLAIRSQKLPDDWSTFNTQSMLGGSLLGAHKYADAEPLLLAGYEGLKQRESTIPPAGRLRLSEALERLVQLYDEWGKADEAAKWKAEFVAHEETHQKNKQTTEQP